MISGKNGYRLPDAEWQYAAGKLPEPANAASFANLSPANTKDSGPLVAYARANGPKMVASLASNEHGLYDMLGNVWEWVQDYQDPSGAVSATVNPSGPTIGVARIIRGGSYLTTTFRWGRNYRSSLEPQRKSPYTGFRVCRNIVETPSSSKTTSERWFDPYRQSPAAFSNATGGLSSLVPPGSGRDAWPEHRSLLQSKWAKILGNMSGDPPPVAVRPMSTHHEPTYTGELMMLQVEPDYWEKIYVMLPTAADRSRPLPVVIVPFYDVDTPAGRSLGGRSTTPLGTRAYAHLAIQHGMAAVAIRWFGESLARTRRRLSRTSR